MKVWGVIAFFYPYWALASRYRRYSPTHNSSDGWYALLIAGVVIGVYLIPVVANAVANAIGSLRDAKAKREHDRRIRAEKLYESRKKKFMEDILAECGKLFGAPMKSLPEIKKYIEREHFEKLVALQREYHEKSVELQECYEKKDQELRQREEIINTKSLKFPPLAKCLAKFDELKLLRTAEELESKKHPALSSAQKVRSAVHEAKDFILNFHACKNLVDSYEALFPWIMEYREFDIDEILQSSSDEEESDDPVKRYMTKTEYVKLSPVQRNQMALERFLASKKSNWQIGRMYERFVGYEYEQKGYKVSYFGAVNGMEDLGRDIIAVKGYQHLIVQCKYWKKERPIHENVICQLYGSTVRYRIDHSEKDLFGEKYDVHAVLVTSASCSEMARDFAKYLNVEIFEGKKYEDYPMIKCNVSRDGEKIYHLPFDQMYDRVIIEPHRGEFYAQTCFEAEEKGFRRAFRWHGKQEG